MARKHEAGQSIVLCLEALKEFIENNVASKVQLLKENSTDEYVNPYVGLVTLPHKNFMPVNFQVPHINIGLVTGKNDVSKEHTLNIRLQVATYGGNIQFQEDANLPDEKGYIDLLNLQERLMHELMQAAVIGNCVIDTDFDYGIYAEEITYPYCYGYIQFSMTIPNMNRQPLEYYL